MKYKRTSMITEVLENRRNAVANMVGLGYSVEQISRFFECPVRGIKEPLSTRSSIQQKTVKRRTRWRPFSTSEI